MPQNYYVFIGGKKVPVDEDVYRAFVRPLWAAQRKKRRLDEKEIKFLSLDAFIEDGCEPASAEPLVDEIVEDKLLLEMLYAALHELTDDERDLIDALFYQAKSEREFAKERGLSRTTLQYRKEKIINKLRKYFGIK